MKDFLYEYSMSRNNERINHDLFNRSDKFDKPLHMYIIETCKNLEIIPNLKLVDWELITDQTKINISINKKLTKDKAIKNNKLIDKIVSLSNTLCDLLKLTFTKTINGRTEKIVREILVFRRLSSGELYINGSKALPLNQITENSTFVKDDIVKYKASLYGIDIFKKPIMIEFDNGDTAKTEYFQLNLFERITNPLVYYFARYGILETIRQFDLDSVISIVPSRIDTKRYSYVKVPAGYYIEVHKDIIDSHPFVLTFVGSMYQAIKDEKIDEIYDKNHWLIVLAKQFSKKTEEKGKRILMSFSKVVDQTTKHRLASSLKKHHIRDTHTLIKWIMTNHHEILGKDNHDLANKRIRTNEAIAFYFDTYITRSLNSVLNSDNITSDSLDGLLNSINTYSLIRALYSNKENKYSLFRYEKYNDLDAINLSRYTFKGPGGLNGGKHRTSLKYRDIYPSHINRFDLNVCSASEPGLTGYLCANVDILEGGHFAETVEPDSYESCINDAIRDISLDSDYLDERRKLLARELSRNENGKITLKRKRIINKDTVDVRDLGLYEYNGKYRIMRKYVKNKKGKIILTRRGAGNKVINPKYVFSDRGKVILSLKDSRILD